jgi:hypothetical protein
MGLIKSVNLSVVAEAIALGVKSDKLDVLSISRAIFSKDFISETIGAIALLIAFAITSALKPENRHFYLVLA